MKIGIVTFHTAANHGAAWQAFALQEATKKLGAQPEFIQFEEKEVDNTPDTQLAERLKKFPRLAKERERKIQCLETKQKHFKDFRSQCFNISQTYTSTDAIDANYDAFFAGSDQIWNYELTQSSTNYFLSFAQKHKRFAYAASFGLEVLPGATLPWYKHHLTDFARISVRESNAVDMVKNIANKQAEHCLDPTLLLTNQEWSALLEEHHAPISDCQDKHILLYIINPDLALIKKAQQVALENNLPLKVVSAGFIPNLGEEAWINTGVLELLWNIRHAKYVITDSFHGLALSLTFHRPLILGKMGLESTRSSRLHSLLHIAGITPDELSLKQAIDWQRVSAQLSKKRQHSYAYLEECLKSIE